MTPRTASRCSVARALLLGLAAGCGEPGGEARPGALDATAPTGGALGGPLVSAQLTPLRVDPALSETHRVPALAGALAGSSVLLVTLDTTRADRIGCYGNPAIRTPTLDRLAASGVVFSDVTAVAPTTLPSHASILTGLYPWHHGVRANGLYRFEDRRATLAERLHAEGYRTGAVVSAFVLDAQYGLARGFDSYDDDLSASADPAANHYRELDAASATDRALAWLARSGEGPFLLWVHYFDPHHGYAPPPPFAAEYSDQPYDGEIAYVDAELARLLAGVEAAGWMEETLVVVVGDHGEGLGQHHEVTHGYQTYDSTLRVPLVLAAGERLGGGVHCTRSVSQVDVAPLVLALLGLEFREPRDGDDLLGPGEGSGERPVFFETLAGALEFGWQPLRGVCLGPSKYIHSSRPELYRRDVDPTESDNRVATEPALAARLLGLLEDAFGGDLGAIPAPAVEPDAEDLAQLQALGYFESGTDAGASGAGRREAEPPQDVMPLLHRVNLASDEAKPVDLRVEELGAILAEHADFYPAWKALADVCRDSGDLERAAAALGRCLELRPGSPVAVYELALVRATRGEGAAALELLEPAATRWPHFVRVRYLLGTLLAQAGQAEQAIPHLRAVFDLDPDHDRCVENLVACYQRLGRGTQACGLLDEHLAAHPRATRVRLALATLYRDLGDAERSELSLREGLALAPDDTDLIRGAVALFVGHTDPSRRDPEAAIDLLEEFTAASSDPPAVAWLTLSSLYGMTGRTDQALGAARRALEHAEAQGVSEVRAAAQQQIRRLGGG